MPTYLEEASPPGDLARVVVDTPDTLVISSFRLPGDADPGVSMQRMLDEAETLKLAGAPIVTVRWPPNLKVAQTLEVRGDGIHHIMGGKVEATAMMDSVIDIYGRSCTFEGVLDIWGGPSPSGQNYAGRLALDGMRLFQSHSSAFGFVRVQGVRRHGIVSQAFDGLDVAFSMLTTFDHIKTVYCGSAGNAGVPSAQVTMVVTGRTDTGSQNDPGQLTVLDCVPHADIEVGGLVHVGPAASYSGGLLVGTGEFAYVVAVDGTSISVFPWLDLATVTGATIVSAHGAGLMTFGGNAGGLKALVDATQCGEGVSIRSLYGPQIQCQFHATCVGLRVGSTPGDGPNGFGVSGYYSEDDILVTAPIVKVSRSASGDISGIQAMNLNKIISLAARNASGVLYTLFEGLDNIQLQYNGVVVSERVGSRGGESAAINASNFPRHDNIVHHKNNVTFVLQYFPHLDRIARSATIQIDCWGGTGTGPGSVTFNIDATQDPTGTVGNTQGGGASLTDSPTGPTRYVLMRRNTSTDWVVTSMPLTRL